MDEVLHRDVGAIEKNLGRHVRKLDLLSEKRNVDHAEGRDRSERSDHDVIAEVVDSVNRVSNLVGGITSATAVQSESIADVNQAVTRIGEATQENAAMAVQAADNCGALQVRAATLTRAVQIFRLNER